MEFFWTKWTQDVLYRMQSRPKWKQHCPSLKKGDLVIIQADHLPPLDCILELIPGSDGIPRVANPHTAMGLARRSINRLNSEHSFFLWLLSIPYSLHKE
ncbi:hypothetical protein AVEN_141176-1 [Araneus ventricosus]|uniref:DUF5641 domain-containing protein n=1 Tax=Araneus ventricosus TaxID=182803 RepID=A0A4Y2EU88_ARAVE|nr:hypothetical protein AVEN_141176-1 [Araneus ventricosus]